MRLNHRAATLVSSGMTPPPSARLVLAAAAVTVVALAACGSSKSGGTAGASSHPAAPSSGGSSSAVSGPKITIKGFGYSGTLTVPAGAKVTVLNQDSVAHTVTDKKTHLFDTGSVSGNGGIGTFTAPKKAGKYPFGCTFHPEMAGTLTVSG
jgi:plastocyanin